MKQGTAKAERNLKPSLTLPMATRSPIEAFNMLRQGQPVDVMSAYYDDKELLDKDVWMLDKTAKLRHLAELKKLELDLKRNQTFHENEIKIHEQNLLNEQAIKGGQAAERHDPKPTGQVPESGPK